MIHCYEKEDSYIFARIFSQTRWWGGSGDQRENGSDAGHIISYGNASVRFYFAEGGAGWECASASYRLHKE